MKKPISAFAAAAMAATCLSVSPASAGNGGAFAAGVIGGAVGAIILNEAVNSNRKRHRNYRRRSTRPRLTAEQREENREIQRRLNALDFDAGTPDGLFGPRTRTAIRDFQRSIGERATGKLTNTQIVTLYEQTDGYASGGVLAGGAYAAPYAQPGLASNPFAPPAAAGHPAASAQPQPSGPGATVQPVSPTVSDLDQPQAFREARAAAPVPAGPVAAAAAGVIAASVDRTVGEPAPAGPASEMPSGPAFSDLETRPGVFGIMPGSDFGAADGVLAKNGFSNCITTGETLACERKTAALTDKVVIAAAPLGTVATVHTVMRELAFNQPVTRSFMIGQLTTGYPVLVKQPGFTAAPSAACSARLGDNPTASFGALFDKSAASDLFDEQTRDFARDCSNFYAIDMPAGDKISSVKFTFFDATGLRAEFDRIAAAKTAAQKSNEEAVANDIKF